MIKIGTYTTLILLLVMIGTVFWSLSNLPETGSFPIHWNLQGEANGFATRKSFALMMWFLVLTAAGTGLLFTYLPKLDPLKENLLKSSKIYMISWIGTQLTIALTMIAVCIMIVRAAKTGVGFDFFDQQYLLRFILAATAIFIILLGNYLPKSQQNWFIGVRTPWTLSSPEAWNKTHRLAGPLFMLTGLATLYSAIFLPVETNINVFAISLIGTVIVTVIASFFFWKNASDKTT